MTDIGCTSRNEAWLDSWVLVLGGLHGGCSACTAEPRTQVMELRVLWLPLCRCGADKTVQGRAQGGEGGEARERSDQAAPVSARPGHLCGGLSEYHVPFGGGGTPGQEEARTYHPCHTATVSPLLVGTWAPSRVPCLQV